MPDIPGSPGNTMQVARLHEKRQLRLHEEPSPRARPGEVLVRVRAVGVCGSDLHWFEEGAIGEVPFTSPMVLGHEFAAVTQEGRRVAVDPAIACTGCELCLAGHPNLCDGVRFAGSGEEEGALREWMAWPERCLVPLPDDFTWSDGAMLEPLGVALHAVDLAHLHSGMSVGVFGCGPIGLLTLQLARLSGASRLFATDLASRPHRLAAARSLGAEAFAAEGGREAKAIREASGSLGLDVAIEAAGDNAAVDAAVDAVRPGARIVLAGIPPEARTSFMATTARRKGLSFVLARRMKHTYPKAIRLVASGAVDVRSLVTHRFPLASSQAAFEAASAREGLKVVVEI